MPEISVLVEGGKATAGAPLGPALGPTGLNIGEVVAQINQKTKSFEGIKVPVKIIADTATKSFEIQVGSPPVSALIKKELGIPKGAANPKMDKAGNLSMDQVKKIAEMKADGLNSYNLFSSAREVIGTANSMGVFIEEKHAKEIQKEFADGKFNELFGRENIVQGLEKEAGSFVEGMAKAARDLTEPKESAVEPSKEQEKKSE